MKECCQKQENRVQEQLENGMVVERCVVCGCRHYDLNAEPGVIFAKPA